MASRVAAHADPDVTRRSREPCRGVALPNASMASISSTGLHIAARISIIELIAISTAGGGP